MDQIIESISNTNVDILKAIHKIKYHDEYQINEISNDAKESINTYGAIYGSFLAIKRILRCNPFSNAPLYDPVPLKKERKNEKY